MAQVVENPTPAFASAEKAQQVTGRLVRRMPELNPKANDGQPSLFDTGRLHAFFNTASAAERDTVAAAGGALGQRGVLAGACSWSSAGTMVWWSRMKAHVGLGGAALPRTHSTRGGVEGLGQLHGLAILTRILVVPVAAASVRHSRAPSPRVRNSVSAVFRARVVLPGAWAARAGSAPR